MNKDTTTYVALDDSKRKLVVGILRPGDREPELREIPNESKRIHRRFGDSRARARSGLLRSRRLGV